MASSSVAQFNPSQSPNYGFTIPNAPSPNMRALLAYVDALKAWNFNDIMACFDEALEHRILPQSLGRPVLSKRQYGEYFGAIMPLLKNFQVSRSTWNYHPSFSLMQSGIPFHFLSPVANIVIVPLIRYRSTKLLRQTIR
jgi:hypothetical protein